MLQRRRSYEASLAPSDSISQVSERRYQKQQQSHQRHYSSQQSPSYSYGGGRGANVIVLDSKGRMLPQRGQTYHSYVPQSQPSSPAESRGRVVYLQSNGGKHTRSQSVPRNASSGQRYYYTESPPRASSPASPTKYVINGRTYTVMPSQPSRNHSTGSHSTSSSSTSKESMGHRIRRLLGMNSGSSASGGRRHTPPPNSSSRFIQW